MHFLKRKNDKRGIASLGATLILGAIVIEIGLAIAILAYLLNFSNLGIRLSAEALSAARSGVDDAFMRIIRDDYTNNVSYNFGVGAAGATVVICKGGTGDCMSLDDRKKEIRSTGAVLGRTRKLIAIVEGGTSTPMIIESIKETSL